MMFSKKYLEDAKCELETALDPEEEVKFEEAPVQSPQPEPLLKPYVAKGAPLNLVSSTCICILQSGSRKGQECGKPVKANNRCGTHQKKCVEPEKVQVEKISEQISTCPCIIQSGKNKGQVCGKTVIEGTVRCKSHKNACILPETESKTEIEEPVEPIELLESEPVVQGQLDPDQYEESKEPVEPIVPPEPIETSDWLVVPVTKKELVRILQTTPIVDIDVEQLNILENEILKCFSV